jgi:type I restriction enzyme M protein
MAPQLTAAALAAIYREAHDEMRNLDGLQPQDAFEELLKYLFFRQHGDSRRDAVTSRTIRTRFARYLGTFDGAAKELWTDRTLRLSDCALLAVHGLVRGVDLSHVDFDVRSAALRMFLGPDLRRGLGIYLTPDEVVRAIVQAAAPEPGSVVYDPACGSGTFLIETLRHWRQLYPQTKTLRVRGSDINARMVLLTELNLGYVPGVALERRVKDALADGPWPPPDSIDVILTNPPFGVYVEPSKGFTTAGKRESKVPSEVLFVERCLGWLRPGGLLAIVVPRSVITNESLADARKAIDALACLVGVLTLPPETFVSTGTQTNTSVLFLKKRSPAEPRPSEVDVPVVDVSNVGFDATGRPRSGSELDRAGSDLGESMRSGRAQGMARRVRVPTAACLFAYGNASIRRSSPSGPQRLADIVELARTGHTPARSAYTAAGVFTLKVGNLTGQGIDWSPRDRNFVDPRSVTAGLFLAEGDIVLTSSAHNPKYIAQKVDIVHAIPNFAGGRATFVGEVLRLRVKPGRIDPYALLALLRMPATKAAIRDMVRGQTAHLRPKDLLELPLGADPLPEHLVELLRQEAELARQLNIVVQRERELLSGLRLR